MQYRRISISGPAVVVAFDMCSSSNIIEELTLSNDIKRLTDFLTSLKRYLAKAQAHLPFDPYKFTGDGWILLFPPDTNGIALLRFLEDLCSFFAKEFRTSVLRYLDNPPSLVGLTFGIEKGALIPMTMYGQPEYIGRAINVACRLQGAVKDKGRSPAYNALVSNRVFTEYFSSAKPFRIDRVRRTLRNINQGADFRCRRISLMRQRHAP